MMHGHSRSITQIKYNQEGDLLFSCAKDHQPNVWYGINGERLGTYDGHTGACWCLDPNWDNTQLITGAADNSIRMWDVETGKQIGMIQTNTAVRSCNYSYGGDMVCFTTDKQMKYPCEITMVDPRNFRAEEIIHKMEIPPAGPKVTSMIWSNLDKHLITGHQNGDMVIWETREIKKLVHKAEHTGQITDLQKNVDGTMVVSSSKDNRAMVWDAETLEVLKTYTTERPVNSAAFSPLYEHVVLGGGQEAMDVTTTSSKSGKFDARFFHLVFEEEFGRVKGHFGPINSLAYHPDGRGYASGGEDGYVRVHTFDDSYHEFKFDY